jgi:hypothetical protein
VPPPPPSYMAPLRDKNRSKKGTGDGGKSASSVDSEHLAKSAASGKEDR